MKIRNSFSISTILCLMQVGLAIYLSVVHRPSGPLASAAFVWIPPGHFTMGSPLDEPKRDPRETPHRVTLSGFWMARYVVTQEEWESVMKVNPSCFRGLPRLPVEGVTWYDAVAYCNLRSMRDGLSPCYRYNGSGSDPGHWPKGWKQRLHDSISCDWSAGGYRLPTEAEWEYACRAGTTTATSFGDKLTSRQANFNGEEPYNTSEKGPNLRRTTPVGSYLPNAWGLYDMHGNTSQWCWDWYSDYSPQEQNDPRGPAVLHDRRVFRGGSWFSHGSDLRSAARFSDTPHFRLDMLPGGLRLARSATQ